jgi:hypothetical protein
MSVLNGLKLSGAKRTTNVSPAIQRRSKLSKHIAEQIAIAKCRQEGTQYSSTKLRKVTDAETGEVKSVRVEKRIKEWAWTNAEGKTFVSLRYGAKLVELAKGKTAVELANVKDLVPTLEVLQQAVTSGELDDQLALVSSKVKAGFGKK